ncbi:hypothetical protein [Phascolarctobacterium faecium]|uniref:hypothetical protein n=1 Tax=Phascolarctobacterium faecium TaxID=33025 RepID=UPI003A8F26CB
MKQSQETCQFFNNPFMTCDVRVGYMNRSVVIISLVWLMYPKVYLVNWGNGADYMLSNMVCVLCCPDILHRAGKEWSK